MGRDTTTVTNQDEFSSLLELKRFLEQEMILNIWWSTKRGKVFINHVLTLSLFEQIEGLENEVLHSLKAKLVKAQDYVDMLGDYKEVQELYEIKRLLKWYRIIEEE